MPMSYWVMLASALAFIGGIVITALFRDDTIARQRQTLDTQADLIADLLTDQARLRQERAYYMNRCTLMDLNTWVDYFDTVDGKPVEVDVPLPFNVEG